MAHQRHRPERVEIQRIALTRHLDLLLRSNTDTRRRSTRALGRSFIADHRSSALAVGRTRPKAAIRRGWTEDRRRSRKDDPCSMRANINFAALVAGSVCVENTPQARKRGTFLDITQPIVAFAVADGLSKLTPVVVPVEHSNADPRDRNEIHHVSVWRIRSVGITEDLSDDSIGRGSPNGYRQRLRVTARPMKHGPRILVGIEAPVDLRASQISRTILKFVETIAKAPRAANPYRAAVYARGQIGQ
jgi:hypothetical protein